MAIGRITGQMLSSTLSRDTVDLTLATTGESNLLHVDATNDRIGIGLNNPSVQFQTTGSAIVGTDLTVTGNLTVNGSTTTINTTNLTVDDKNIELAHSLSGQAPTDAAADGGGIILKGDTDHTILWSNAQNSWDFSENVSVATGSAFQINNVNVLDANNLTLESIQIAGNTITSSSNADISLQPSGTGVVKLSGISIDGDVITSDDSTAVTIGENLNIDGTLSFNDGQGVDTISNDSTLAGSSSTALVTEFAVKSYVDSVAGGTITLGDSASNSGSVDINGGQDLEFRSGDGITLIVSGNGVTATLNKAIDVNEISSSDSTAIQINDGVNITGALNVASSLEIGNGPVITAILDEDAMGSNSDTAIPTQQSVKAYVDTEIAGLSQTIKFSDDTSAVVTIDMKNDTVSMAGGNSITSTITDDTITFALDKSIDVNEISSSDSTAIQINDGVNITGALNVASSLEIGNGPVITAILDEDAMGSNSDTAIPTQQSVKAYVDTEIAGLSQTIKVSDDTSTVLTLDLKNDTMSLAGGNSITSSISGDTVTFALDKSIDVNEISSTDSTAVIVNDGLNVNGNLDVGSSFTISNGTAITAILDEDGLDSDSDTALATQQSIKAYVDSVAGGTITLGDSASNSGSVDINANQDLEFRSGNSVTLTVSGNGVTAALNKAIDVNEISSSDSTAIQINDGVNITGALNVASSLEIGNGPVITAILDEDNLASDSDTAIPTQQSVKSYVDTEIAGLSQTIKFSDDTSSVVTIDMKNDTVSMAGGNSITSTITDDTITFALDTVIDVNEISSTDSGFVRINDGLTVNGDLDVGSSFSISNGVGITAILNDPDMAADSDTALATQQSIKAYVDEQISGQQINEINDISNVDAQSGDLRDGDILVVNDDSSNVFTISSQMTTALRLPQGSTADRPTAYTGAIRFNTETNQYEGCTDGSTFVAFAMSGIAETLSKDVFTGDGGATYNFSNITNPVSGNDNSNGALGLIVYIDNVLQEPTQNYTITDSAITFDSVIHSGARIVAIQGFDGSAGGGAGGSGLSSVENTDVDSAVEDLDTFSTTLYRAVKYVYRIENAGSSEYQAGEILVVHDGSTAYLTEYAKIATGNNDLITFTTDISGGNVRLRGSAQAPNSNFLAKKIVLGVV